MKSLPTTVVKEVHSGPSREPHIEWATSAPLVVYVTSLSACFRGGAVRRRQMRIVSLNAWGGAEFDSLADWLPQCGAEVVCLQEVTRIPGLGGWTRFADGERSLPQRANLFDDVRRLLPRHQGTFITSEAGPVQDADGCAHRQDFGIAMFIGESVPLISTGSSFVHGSFADHVEWPKTDRPRVAQAVRLVDRASGRTVLVTHLHGLRGPNGKMDTRDRAAQAVRLAELVTRMRESNDLVVVAGDLNLLPDSETFEVLEAIDLVDLVGYRDTRTSLYSKAVRHANYLLISEKDSVQGFDTPASPEVSDHRPLILDL